MRIVVADDTGASVAIDAPAGTTWVFVCTSGDKQLVTHSVEAIETWLKTCLEDVHIQGQRVVECVGEEDGA